MLEDPLGFEIRVLQERSNSSCERRKEDRCENPSTSLKSCFKDGRDEFGEHEFVEIPSFHALIDAFRETDHSARNNASFPPRVEEVEELP